MIFLSDPRVAQIPVRETFDPLVTLGRCFGPDRARVRSALAARLRRAQVALPVGLRLQVVEGHRSLAAQRAVTANRFAAPPAVAPHVAGAAVHLTLVDLRGRELDMGTPIDATAEESVDAAEIPADARMRRSLLARVLTGVGLVNYPPVWWHWSYGDRYWALLSGAPAGLYGPVEDLDAPAWTREAA